jgi:hypothetical protein
MVAISKECRGSGTCDMGAVLKQNRCPCIANPGPQLCAGGRLQTMTMLGCCAVLGVSKGISGLYRALGSHITHLYMGIAFVPDGHDGAVLRLRCDLQLRLWEAHPVNHQAVVPCRLKRGRQSLQPCKPPTPSASACTRLSGADAAASSRLVHSRHNCNFSRCMTRKH